MKLHNKIFQNLILSATLNDKKLSFDFSSIRHNRIEVDWFKKSKPELSEINLNILSEIDIQRLKNTIIDINSNIIYKINGTCFRQFELIRHLDEIL